MVRFAPFFLFFFLNFGPKRAVSADSADTGRYGPSRPDLGRVGADFGRVGADFSRVSLIRESPRGTTRHGRAVCGVPPASPRRTRVRSPGSCVRASQLLAHTMLLGFSIYRVNIYKCSQLPFNLDDSLGFKPTS